ncbi:unnamed protein product [Merluccius merluccius]
MAKPIPIPAAPWRWGFLEHDDTNSTNADSIDAIHPYTSCANDTQDDDDDFYSDVTGQDGDDVYRGPTCPDPVDYPRDVPCPAHANYPPDEPYPLHPSYFHDVDPSIY